MTDDRGPLDREAWDPLLAFLAEVGAERAADAVEGSSWGLGGDTGELPAVNGDAPAAEEAEAEGEDGWCYPTVHDWVADWALPTLGRSPLARGQRWCNQWDTHPDAVLRLELAWKKWERARHDPAALHQLATGHLGPHVGRPYCRRRPLRQLHPTTA